MRVNELISRRRAAPRQSKRVPAASSYRSSASLSGVDALTDATIVTNLADTVTRGDLSASSDWRVLTRDERAGMLLCGRSGRAARSAATLVGDSVAEIIAADTVARQAQLRDASAEMSESVGLPVNAADSAYERLREELLAGRLMPGQRLVEAELVESLGVSRAIVRSVLSRLAHDGLVDKEPNRGARVRMVSEEEAIEITQVRASLEGLAARFAAMNATSADVEQMREILAEMRVFLGENDLLAYSDCNSKLHRLILTASQHTTAQRLIANLRAQMVRFQYRTILVPGRPNESLAEHTALVDAIVARDGDKAEAAMRTHLSHVTENLARTKQVSGLVAPR